MAASDHSPQVADGHAPHTQVVRAPAIGAATIRELLIIGDYGRVDDPAFLQVYHALVRCLEPGVQPVPIASGVAPWDELGGGFLAAMAIGGRAPVPDNSVVLFNAAPRKDDPGPRPGNAGEGFVVGRVPWRTNVTVVGTSGGYSLSTLASLPGIDFRVLPIGEGPTQFRSRDLVPTALGRVLSGETPFDQLEPFAVGRIPPLPLNTCAEFDGYRNIKLTVSRPDLAPGTPVTLLIKAPRFTREGYPKAAKLVKATALIAKGSFEVPEWTLAFAEGSSAIWQPGGQDHFAGELFLRGGFAGELLGIRPPIRGGGLLQSGATFRVFDVDGHEVRPQPLLTSQEPLVAHWRPGPGLEATLRMTTLKIVDATARFRGKVARHTPHLG